jgi:hypothetical protein
VGSRGMTQNDMLGRRNTILKKSIAQMILKEYGGRTIHPLEHMMKKRMIRELFSNYIHMK